jgi:hypothetical protein
MRDRSSQRLHVHELVVALDIVEAAIATGSRSIAYTYNDPVIVAMTLSPV